MPLTLSKLRTQEGDSQRRIENTEDRIEEIVSYLNLAFSLPFPVITTEQQYQVPALNATVDAFTFQHVLRTPSALALTGSLSAGQVLTFNGTNVVGGSAGTVPVVTVLTGNNTLASNTVVGINANTIQTLPLNPTVGDYIWIFRNEGADFEADFSTLNRNTRNIEGLASDYTLDRNVGAVLLWYAGSTLGWKVNILLGELPLPYSGDGGLIATATGTLTSGNLTSFDANGNVVDSGLDLPVTLVQDSLITVNNSTTYVSIPGLTFTPLADAWYHISGSIQIETAEAAGARIQITGIDVASFSMEVKARSRNATDYMLRKTFAATTLTLSTIPAGWDIVEFQFSGRCKADSIATPFAINFAQGTATASNTHYMTTSYLRYERFINA